jgi:ABC-type uncharacterized transport system ATPase subunit
VGDTTNRGLVLEVRGLTQQFAGFTALNNLDFQVEFGHIHGVIGPNGAGKTTLFNCITGELTPTAGQVFFHGKDITGLSPDTITARGIARKFQITQVFSSLTVADNVMLALQRSMVGSMFGLLRRIEMRSRIAEILDLVHLNSRADAAAAELAHGERQRLELGMVLATGAELLLLDEPTSGMSLEERDEIGALLRAMSQRATILITEHDFQFIKQVAQVITVLNKGEKVAEGSVSEIECDAAVRDCYLGTASHA